MKKYLYALVFLPATFIHELSHYLMAKLLLVPVGKFNLIPRSVNNEFVLGSVMIAKTDLIRGSLIGLAPFIVGIILLYLLTTTAVSALTIYFLFQIINSMLLSLSDLKAFVKLLFIALLIYLLYLLYGSFG